MTGVRVVVRVRLGSGSAGCSARGAGCSCSSEIGSSGVCSSRSAQAARPPPHPPAAPRAPGRARRRGAARSRSPRPLRPPRRPRSAAPRCGRRRSRSPVRPAPAAARRPRPRRAPRRRGSAPRSRAHPRSPSRPATSKISVGCSAIAWRSSVECRVGSTRPARGSSSAGGAAWTGSSAGTRRGCGRLLQVGDVDRGARRLLGLHLPGLAHGRGHELRRRLGQRIGLLGPPRRTERLVLEPFQLRLIRAVLRASVPGALGLRRRGCSCSPLPAQAAKDYAVILSLARQWDQLPIPAEPGAIAQLAERLDRTQEVGGSNPPSSIGRTPCMSQYRVSATV